MNLKRYLFEKTLPVKQFAKRLGVSASLIYHIINRQRTPSPALAIKIEELTEGLVTKEELLFPGQETSKKWVLGESEVGERFEDHERRISKLEKMINDIPK